MARSSSQTITQLLDELRSGNQTVIDELFARVYEELQQRAHQQRQHWRGDYTLNTTALVHEAYLKLVDQEAGSWENRAHFFSVAAKAMRHILINYARDKSRKKRGGSQPEFSLEEMREMLEREPVLSEERAEALVVLDEALERLEQVSDRQSRIVECRFFGGMTIKETAAVLDISTATVSRGWALARTWLYREMKQAMES